MKQLQIEDSKAKSLYKIASPEFKQILEDTFGKTFFLDKITDRIKTYEDACRELRKDPIYENAFRANGFTIDEINYRKLKTITKVLNEGWIPDWANNNENKWQPYFRLSSGGFVFDDTGYRYSYTDVGNASRLCFKSDELATYAGQQFIDIYKGFMF